MAFATTLARLRHLEISIELDGVCLRRRTALVWMGLGWGTFPLPQQAPPQEEWPQLEVAVLRPGSRRRLASLLLRVPLHLLGGEHPREHPALELLHTRHLRLTARQAIGATLDGEVLELTPPAEVTIDPHALQVVSAPDP